MAEQHKVKTEDKLLNFLFTTLHTWSKKKVKERLKSATVAVNGKITTKHDFPLSVDDLVEIGVIQKKSSNPINNLDIIYQDDELIAINKPAGLLSVGTKQENKNHALAILRQQLTRGRKSPDLIPVHRHRRWAHQHARRVVAVHAPYRHVDPLLIYPDHPYPRPGGGEDAVAEEAAGKLTGSTASAALWVEYELLQFYHPQLFRHS